MSVPPAARKTDHLAHNWGQWGRFGGFLISFRLSAAAVRVALGFLGPGGWLAIGASFVIEWAVSKAAQAALEAIGEQFTEAGIPEIAQGSDDVFINGLPAARGGDEGDRLSCHGGKKIREGSRWVNINKKPAARFDDRTECSGKVVLKPGTVPNVFTGGPAVSYSNELAIQEFLSMAMTVRGFLEPQRAALVLGRINRSELLASAAEEGATRIADAIWDATSPSLRP